MADQHLLPGYETVFITKNEMTDDALAAMRQRMVGIIESFSGKSVAIEDLGKRKMAYTIQKESRGHYTLLVYTGQPGVVAEIERNLRISDQVVRFLSIQISEEYEPSTYERKAYLDDKPETRDFSRGGYRGGDRWDRGGRGSGDRYDRGGDRGDRGGDRGDRGGEKA